LKAADVCGDSAGAAAADVCGDSAGAAAVVESLAPDGNADVGCSG